VESPYAPGDFVSCLFPFREQPHRPGPMLHVVYCERLFAGSKGRAALAAFYTTTVLHRPDEPKRPWIVEISEGSARKMGMQKAFAIDTHRIGFMPITMEFFPDLDRPDRGIRGRATPHLQSVLDRKWFEAAKDPALLQLVGPEVPWPPRSGGSRG
jgi:hypothetical protein